MARKITRPGARRYGVIDAAIRTAIAEVKTFPGEFTAQDVIRLTNRELGVEDSVDVVGQVQLGTAAIIAPKHRGKGYERIIKLAIYTHANALLRRECDDYGLRTFMCYRVRGKTPRHWLKMDNLTLTTLEALTNDRNKMVDSISDLGAYLKLGQEMLRFRGPHATFGDVKAAVVSAMRDRKAS